jgi:hypothetical protein
MPARADRSAGSRRKLIAFDSETFHTLALLARDRMMTMQELADEAFRDLLRKHGRPMDLRDALKRSAGPAPAADKASPARRPAARHSPRHSRR